MTSDGHWQPTPVVVTGAENAQADRVGRGLNADAEVNAQMRASLDQSKTVQIGPVMLKSTV